MKNLFQRLTNVGTIITLASLVVLLLSLTGVVEVDSEKVMNIVYVACSIGVLLGILNNPETSGIDLPGVNYPVFKEPNLKVDEIAEAAINLNAQKSSKKVRDELEIK